MRTVLESDGIAFRRSHTATFDDVRDTLVTPTLAS